MWPWDMFKLLRCNEPQLQSKRLFPAGTIQPWVVPVLFLFVAGWLLINTMWTSPKQSFIGIFLILLGLPVYYYLTTRKSGETTEE